MRDGVMAPGLCQAHKQGWELSYPHGAPTLQTLDLHHRDAGREQREGCTGRRPRKRRLTWEDEDEEGTDAADDADDRSAYSQRPRRPSLGGDAFPLAPPATKTRASWGRRIPLSSIRPWPGVGWSFPLKTPFS